MVWEWTEAGFKTKCLSKPVARIAPLTGADQRTFINQVVQIAGCGRQTCPSNRPVIPGTQPTRKAVWPFAEQAKQSFFLPFVDLAAQAIEQPRLVDQEADARDRPRLRLDDNIGKPCQPGVNVVALAAELERGVIGFAVSMDRFSERRQRRGRKVLRQSLFSDPASDTAIAIFKGMDALKPQVRDGGSGDRRKRVR